MNADTSAKYAPCPSIMIKLMSSENALYADLSQYYDQFCADIDYGQHVEFSLRIHRCFGGGGKSYLDLACGTGQLLMPMAKAGYSVSGLDYSAAMLAEAEKRCPDADLIHSDMANLGRQNEFDLVTCFLYSLHYSYPLSAVQHTLERVYQSLKPDGVFLFDTVDKGGIKEKDVVSTYQDEDSLLTFRSGWRYPKTGDALTLNISIQREDEKGLQTWNDKHTMTASHIRDLINMMSDIGFEVTPLEHDFGTLREWRGDTFNAIIVGCRPN